MSSLRDGARVRVLHVTPECAPMTKTGGLGDVSQALPAALRADGVDAMTLLPGYPAVLSALAGGSMPTLDQSASRKLAGRSLLA